MAPWFLTFLIFAGLFVAMELLRPKPQFEDARPAGLGDFTFPTATEGRAVPLIWGTVRLRAPNVVWYGNFRSVERTQEVSTGLFSSDDVVIGYKYYVGMHMALCMGPVDACKTIRIKEVNVGSGRTGTGSLGVSAANLMGGVDEGGGFSGQGFFYAGETDDPINAYLDSKISGPLPAYRGICHYVWQGGYVGTSTNIPSWGFELVRLPDGLNMATADPGAEAPNTWDCNPMNAIYEIMTNTSWGLGIAVAKIDIPNFQAAASTCYAEGNGFSMVVDREKSASDVLKELERQVDGLLYFNRETGQWRIALARDDYTVGDLDTYDESNIIALHNYARTTWEETVNEVRLFYADRTDDYKQKYAFAQDAANNLIQGNVVAATVRYPGVKDPTLANSLAWQNLKTLSYPLAKLEFETTREGFALVPGSVFKFDWTRLGVTGAVFRVTKIDYGNLEDGRIRVWAVQDIFAVSAGSFSDPPPTGWQEPVDDYVVTTLADSLVFEAPRQMVEKDPYDPNAKIRVWHGARYPGGNVTRLQTYLKQGNLGHPVSGDYGLDIGFNNFLVRGALRTAIPAYYASVQRPATYYIDVDNNEPDDILTEIGELNGTAADVNALRQIVYMDGEFIGFEVSTAATGYLRLYKLHRGMFNTVPKAHAVDTEVWFIGVGGVERPVGGALTRTGLSTANADVDTQLRSVNRTSESTEVETPVNEIDLDFIFRVPNPPRDPYLNTVYADTTSVSLDTQHLTEASPRLGDDARGILLSFTARGVRIGNITDDANLALDPNYLDDSPRFNVDLTLDPGGTPVTVPAYVISGADAATPEVVLLRNDMITAVGANTAMPTSDADISVEAEHDPVDVPGSTFYACPITMDHSFDITTSLSGTKSFGGIPLNTASTAVVLSNTATYTFDIHYALPSSGIVEININAGGWTTLIGIGASSNTVSITANDSVQLRHTQSPTNGDSQYFDFNGGGESGYGVLLA